MESLKQIVGVGPLMSLVAFGLFVAIAAASRHMIAFLAATLLAGVGCLILVFPDVATAILAAGAGLGSLLMSFAGLQLRRKRDSRDRKVEQLKCAIARLEVAQNAR